MIAGFLVDQGSEQGSKDYTPAFVLLACLVLLDLIMTGLSLKMASPDTRGRMVFSAAVRLLARVLSNVQSAPAEAKFRRLRTTNAKIAAVLAVPGAKPLLMAAGFVGQGEHLILEGPVPGSLNDAASRLATIKQQQVGGGGACCSHLLRIELISFQPYHHMLPPSHVLLSV